MTKRIVLCADDYGQAEAVSAGIRDLLSERRLSAVSCMVNQPHWQQAAASLKPFLSQADIGLHLNLTDGRPLSTLYQNQVGAPFTGLSRLLWQTMARPGTLSLAAVTAEINAQLDMFIETLGCLPAFMDGHQHVHHLPVISAALLDVYEHRLRGKKVYLRAVTQDVRLANIWQKGLKKSVIHYTGGGRFAGRLDALEIAHNTSFSGIYHFADAKHYREHFQRFLQESADGGLIMCHPGRQGNDPTDPISLARVQEYEYFKSTDFTADCERYDVVIERLFPVHA